MRKNFLLTLTLLGSSLAATAQTTPPLPAAVGVQRVRVLAVEMNPELEAARTADQLTGQLTLNPEQTTRVRTATLAWWQARRALLVKHNGLRDHSPLQAESTAIESQYEGKLKATPTPTQKERRQLD